MLKDNKNVTINVIMHINYDDNMLIYMIFML